jgi:FkbM family methyltransferase
MKYRSSGLHTRLSSGLIITATLFTLAFFLQTQHNLHIRSLVKLSPRLNAGKAVAAPEPLLSIQRVRDNLTIHGIELDLNAGKAVAAPEPILSIQRVRDNTTIHGIELDDVKKLIDIFVQRQGTYGNMADFSAFKRLAGVGGFCESKFPTLIGGVNEGGATLKLLEGCPNMKVIGFEIQAPEMEVAKLKLTPYPTVKLYNIGWGEREESNLPISGTGVIAGIYETTGTGRASFEKQEARATVIPMAKWCDDNGVEMTNYVLIDVEGYEPKVIRGMDLSKEKNQKRFSLFQFELGGTWARNDPRHANDWSQRIMGQYLADFGYDLFLIGDVNWMKIQPSFFDEGNHMLDEGYGKFIQGNLLCLHQKFATDTVKEMVFASATTVFNAG